MPMTTESVALTYPSRWISFTRFIGAGSGVLVLWFAVLAVVTVGFEPEETVIAIGPEASILQAFAGSDTLLVSNGRGFVRLRGRSAGFVSALYKHGAWLVLPGSAFGCGAALGTAPRNGRAP